MEGPRFLRGYEEPNFVPPFVKICGLGVVTGGLCSAASIKTERLPIVQALVFVSLNSTVISHRWFTGKGIPAEKKQNGNCRDRLLPEKIPSKQKHLAMCLNNDKSGIVRERNQESRWIVLNPHFSEGIPSVVRFVMALHTCRFDAVLRSLCEFEKERSNQLALCLWRQ